MKNFLIIISTITIVGFVTAGVMGYLDATSLSKKIDYLPPQSISDLTSPLAIPLAGTPHFAFAVSIDVLPNLKGSLSFAQSNPPAAIFTPSNSYEYATTYNLTIKYFGKTIGKGTFTSPTKPEVAALVTNDQTVAANYPLAPYLPYQGEGFYVDYQDKKTLRVRTNSLSQAEATKLVKAYADSKHVNISDHQIVIAPLQ